MRGPLTNLIMLVYSLAMSVSAIASTTVYKVKSPDGSVTYTDQPQENAEMLQVEPVSTVPALRLEDVPSLSRDAAEEGQNAARGYQSLQIVSPAHDTAFHSGNGTFMIQTKLSPALKSGHQFRFNLNGQILSTQTKSSYEVESLDRGAHTISVSVVDANFKTLISQSSTFTIHRPKVSRPGI